MESKNTMEPKVEKTPAPTKREKFQRGRVNMEVVLKNGKSLQIGANFMSQCQNEAMRFAKDNGLNFRKPGDVVSWEAIK